MTSREDASNGVAGPDYGTTGPPTFAAFSPVTLSANTPSRSSRRSTILVHQKSPLLLATPPQITRALAYSHPFILPLNTFVGLLTWSSGDPWQSFLLVCAFWGIVLYGDVAVRWAGPVMVGMAMIAGMYGRRYSPLSSSGWTEPARDLKDVITGNTSNSVAALAKVAAEDKKHARGNSEVTNTKHQKTLDEIVETLKELTGRCNVLMEPLLEMTDFLSTQRTPTSATTKPALTAMFMRLLIITPFWVALALPPWRLITTRRVMLVAGTLILTWHARVSRVSRAILWRSATIRALAATITGLRFDRPKKPTLHDQPISVQNSPAKLQKKNTDSELTKELRRPSFQLTHRRTGSAKSAGVKFTFIIYENQRRWVGLGWTNNLFAYERPAWSDEHMNSVPPKDEFGLPEVEDGSAMQWRWAEGSRWRVDGVADEQGTIDYEGQEGKNGWIYYDNKWQNGRRGSDGWGRWTRRRKWYRDAELVEVEKPHAAELDASDLKSKTSASTLHSKYKSSDGKLAPKLSELALPMIDHTSAEGHRDNDTASSYGGDNASTYSSSSKSFWPSMKRKNADRSSVKSISEKKNSRGRSASDVLSEEEDDTRGLGFETEMALQRQGKEGGEWGIGDEARMSLE